jgi:hypothetical protein
MKWIIIGIFAIFAYTLPLYLYQSLVSPQLISLKQIYSSVDTTANNIANQQTITSDKSAENLSSAIKLQ